MKRLLDARSTHAAQSTVDCSTGDDGSPLIEVTGPEGDREVLFAISPSSGQVYYSAGRQSGLVHTQEFLVRLLQWVDYPIRESTDKALGALRKLTSHILSDPGTPWGPSPSSEMQELLERAVRTSEEAAKLSPEEWADQIVKGDNNG